MAHAKLDKPTATYDNLFITILSPSTHDIYPSKDVILRTLLYTYVILVQRISISREHAFYPQNYPGFIIAICTDHNGRSVLLVFGVWAITEFKLLS